MKTVKIRIKDGMITQIEDIPDNISIIVYDYDTQGTNGTFLSKDDNKKECYVYHWDHADCKQENI